MAADGAGQPKLTVNDRYTSESTAPQADVHPVGLLSRSHVRQGQHGPPSNEAHRSETEVSKPTVKKKRKQNNKGKLSFGDDSEIEDQPSGKKSKSAADDDSRPPARKRLGANSSIAAPKVMTKSALLKEAETKERLKKEFLDMQELVKATEIEIPFVFFDGTNNPGGRCRIKKGEHVWLFLDRSRKIGAELGVGNAERASTTRQWAKVSVDDLMLIRGEIIIPHHYDFYYFIFNKIKGHDGNVLFPYAADFVPGSKEQEKLDLSTYDPLTAYQDSKKISEKILEGANEDATFTKVVDRRWYERNKHIYPASAWEIFEATKDYANTVRRDTGGNTYFFS